MKLRRLVPWVVSTVLWMSCRTPSRPSASLAPTPTSTAAESTAFGVTPAQQSVAAKATEVLWALRDQDVQKLSTLIHPWRGVRFSPYAFVRDTHLVFLPDQLVNLFADPTIYVWGDYDGSGLPIELTFEQYYARFVYDRDYVKAKHIGYNQRIGQGNSIDNSIEYYAGAVVVEYHVPGSEPQFAGMDWRSLRLVFAEVGCEWHLVGIIHDEWTI